MRSNKIIKEVATWFEEDNINSPPSAMTQLTTKTTRGKKKINQFTTTYQKQLKQIIIAREYPKYLKSVPCGCRCIMYMICHMPIKLKRAISSAQGSPLCEGWEGLFMIRNLPLLFAERLFSRLNSWPSDHKRATLLLLPRFTLMPIKLYIRKLLMNYSVNKISWIDKWQTHLLSYWTLPPTYRIIS